MTTKTIKQVPGDDGKRAAAFERQPVVRQLAKRPAKSGAQKHGKFEQLLKSSCNFSLGCDEPLCSRPKSIGHNEQQQQQQQQVGRHSRALLELRNELIAANSTARPFVANRLLGKRGQQIEQRHSLLASSQSRIMQFNQADAASAMVGLVRITLVILICVLLVKLRLVPGLALGARSFIQGKQLAGRDNVNNGTSKTTRRRRRSSSSAKRQAATGACDDCEEQKQKQEREQENESHRATTKISAADKQQEEEDNDEQFRFNVCKSETNFERLLSKLSLVLPVGRPIVGRSNGPQRRLSQPVLSTTATPISTGISSSNWQQRVVQANERRRRSSDTNAIISSLQLPPGPIGLPFLGYLPFLGKEIHLTLTKLGQRFGPIYQIFLGNIRVVVLNDAALIRQAFKQTVFSGRPNTQLTRILQGYGIVNSDGALWKEQRAFLHSALRKLGAKSLMSGTNGLEAKIQNQVREFVNDLSEHAGQGKPCQVRPIVARAVSSVVGSVVMNLTYRKYEEKFDRLIELMQEGFRLVSIAMPLDFIPIFRFLPGVSYAFQKMKRNRAETSAFFQTVADEHRLYLRETFNLNMPNTASSLHPKASQLESSEANIPKTILTSETITRTIVKQQQQLAQAAGQLPLAAAAGGAPISVDLDNIVARDLVDAYIVQQKRHENDGKENYFSDQQLVQIMSDIFSAGLETVTSTIEWSILFLILNPECQQRVQIEIDKIVGRSRLPQLDDLAQMPYTEATIYEVLRRSNVVALGNAHATLADATIGGYRIPKGTQVLPNLYGIHMDPKLWSEPERFDPERFIVNEQAQKPDYFIPFSVGRRMCLGDVLAKMEVFLFLVGLLQKYDLSVHDEDLECPPEVKGTIGVSNAPVPFRVSLRARAHSVGQL